jgi:hypothetical protein
MDGRRLLDVVVGVYVSLLIVTTSALVQWESVASTFSVGVTVSLGLGIATVAALIVATVDDLAETVASVPVAAVTVGLPLLFFPYLLGVPEPGSTQALVAAAGLAAVLPGIGIPVVGGTLENRRQREAATEIAVVTVGDESGSEWWTRLQLGGGILMGIGITIMALGIASGFLDGGTSLITTFGGLVTTVASLLGDDSTELTVTDTGLGIDRGFTRWEAFDGYRVTDDDVELLRPEWYQSTQRFDREEINDEETLIEGLDSYLSRLDEDEETDRTVESTPVRQES